MRIFAILVLVVSWRSFKQQHLVLLLFCFRLCVLLWTREWRRRLHTHTMGTVYGLGESARACAFVIRSCAHKHKCTRTETFSSERARRTNAHLRLCECGVRAPRATRARPLRSQAPLCDGALASSAPHCAATTAATPSPPRKCNICACSARQ